MLKVSNHYQKSLLLPASIDKCGLYVDRGITQARASFLTSLLAYKWRQSTCVGRGRAGECLLGESESDRSRRMAKKGGGQVAPAETRLANRTKDSHVANELFERTLWECQSRNCSMTNRA